MLLLQLVLTHTSNTLQEADLQTPGPEERQRKERSATRAKSQADSVQASTL